MNRPHFLIYCLVYCLWVVGCSGSGDKKETIQPDSSTYDAAGLPPSGPVCQENCVGRDCGPDRCGGTCGTCDGDNLCLGGQCYTPNKTVCDELGDDLDLGDGYCDGMTAVWCEDDGLHLQDCKDDGWAACGKDDDGNWRCGNNVCVPDCKGKQCGDDGCDGDCGMGCAPGLKCYEGTCCEPQCQGKEPYAGNGCGGLCCEDDCAIACNEKQCGEWCGCLCGSCNYEDVCVEGRCVCEPDCGGKECGDDGCGENCGNCSATANCHDGECVNFAWIDSTWGFMWQNAEIESVSMASWKEQAAIEHCSGLHLGGHTDWRLPTIDELRTLIRGCSTTESSGECPLKHDCANCLDQSCIGCSAWGGPADSCYWPGEMLGPCEGYYSSTYADSYGANGPWWMVEFSTGRVWNFEGGGIARCLRSVAD